MIPRRALLASAAVLALVTAAGPAGAAARRPALARLAEAAFGDAGAAARLGRLCLASGLGPAPGPALAALVAGPPASVGETARRVAAAARADYADGRVRTVGGWVLSETETALCVALALDRAV